jgi:hypothetical protein
MTIQGLRKGEEAVYSGEWLKGTRHGYGFLREPVLGTTYAVSNQLFYTSFKNKK